MLTAGWLSAAVENIWLFLVGMVVFFSISLRHDAAQGLDPQGERRHVQEQDVLHVAGQDPALNGGADGDHFIGVDTLVGFLAEDLLHLLLHPGHTGHPADEDHLVDVAGLELRVLQGRQAGGNRLFDQVLDQRLQLGPGQLDVHVLGAGGIGGDEGEVDVRFHRSGELHLRLLRRFLEPLQGHLVLPDVDPLVFLEFVAR